MPPANNTAAGFSASLVLYRSNLEWFKRTLEALVHATDELGGSLALTVIDQSQDPTYSARAAATLHDALKGSAVEAHVDVLATNGGYGAGHNQILARGMADIHLILNPDVELSADALLRAKEILAQHPNVVLLAPIGYGADGQREYLAKRYPSPTVLALRAFAPAWLRTLFSRKMAAYEYRDLSFTEPLQPVTLVSGCCMFVRSQAFREVSGFDQQFFLYFEDYDLSLRLAQLGGVAQSAHITVIHHGGNAARKGLRHILWFCGGMVRFLSRWGWLGLKKTGGNVT